MARVRIWWAAGAAAALLGSFGSAAFVMAGPSSAKDTTLRVMTYNIRGAADPPPRDWASRLPAIKHLLRRHDPDLLGVQEAQWSQMRDLDRELPAYDWIGMGGLGGTRDEFTAIFYRKERFEVLDFDQFWLSGTPGVIGSATWGNRYIRTATWAKLRDRLGGGTLFHLNTHLDHESLNAQTRSARLILDRVRAFPAGVPVVATGDFNAIAGSPTYETLTGPGAFEDTWLTARRRGPQYRTRHGWRPAGPGDRIDWILSRGPVRTLRTEIDPYRFGAVYPSDHHPVIADLRPDRRGSSSSR